MLPGNSTDAEVAPGRKRLPAKNKTQKMPETRKANLKVRVEIFACMTIVATESGLGIASLVSLSQSDACLIKVAPSRWKKYLPNL